MRSFFLACFTQAFVQKNLGMGNLYQDWGEGDTEVLSSEEGNIHPEKVEIQLPEIENDQKKADQILIEMEKSYLKLEKILNVFNRM